MNDDGSWVILAILCIGFYMLVQRFLDLEELVHEKLASIPVPTTAAVGKETA